MQQHPDKQPSFISFSSAMHSVIAMDETTSRSPPASLGQITEAKAGLINQRRNERAQYLQTDGNADSPDDAAKQITWIVNEHPETAAKAKNISESKNIFQKLFDQYVVDHSLASAMGMMNLKTLAWDEEALAIAGITPDHLSKLVPTTAISIIAIRNWRR
ncbi:FGGY family carbohydrate kinase [Bacillus licheniformis]|nr:FGGY family carbohydrate kinase [Bacillus licheniformis]